MPSRPPSACRRPGCGGLVLGGICSRCGPLRRDVQALHDERRGTAAERGYDARWQRLRTAHLAAEPLCRLCWQAGIVTPATLVDHITPIRDGGQRLDDANLQSLCDRCHQQKTAKDVRNRKGNHAGK